MRKEKALVTLLRHLADLLADESSRNPEFASRLANLLVELPGAHAAKLKLATPRDRETLPDVYAEWNARGEAEFCLWLRDQPLPVLRAVIRAQDLDPTRRTVKWKEPDKLADFVTESIRSRLARGSAFIDRGQNK
jgi:hypothetical protein